MKILTSLLLAFTFLVNSTAFANSGALNQEIVKKSIDNFVQKVEKAQDTSEKRKLISELLDSAANSTSKAMTSSKLSKAQIDSVSEFHDLNTDYRNALDQVSDEQLNDFAAAYATEYQKASVIAVLLVTGLALGISWFMVMLGYGAV